MEQRKTIEYTEDIRTEFVPGTTKITFKNIRLTRGITDDDEIVGIAIRKGYAPAFGYDEEEFYMYPVIIVKRTRLETDEEFVKRIKDAEENEKRVREELRTEFLRLKAIFGE